ncbi:MAG: Uma2 family endonuclease [Spirulina sp. SIO3F2]|nr:Uma2 family endonuclease [Spirulina sp. SIO3F2]
MIAIPSTIPRLENGDRLTQIEFERRYHAMPHLKKAELINGIVYMASPLRINQHGEPHALIIGWLTVYLASHSHLQLGDNCTVRLDPDNEPQPDVLLRKRSSGTSTISADGYVEGPPELIVEIAASTVSLDMHQKRELYCQMGVQEYLVWRVEDGVIDWFELVNGKYQLVQPNSAGLLCSNVFPGLRLDRTALLSGNLAQVLAMLQQSP